MKRTEIVAIRLTPVEFEKLYTAAAEAQRTVSDFVRVMIREKYFPNAAPKPNGRKK